jgi:NHLM bacteriocin system ABC transporter peptidase/ATP-binding protein
MEAAECGAASLAMVLAHYRKFVPLETLREECGVSRDGSKASNVLGAAKRQGLLARGFSKSPGALQHLRTPMIAHWNFNHFLVVEGFGKKWVHLNDPASGPRKVTHQDFGAQFTGVVLTFEPGPDLVPSGAPPSVWRSVRRRLAGSETTLLFLALVGLALVLPGLVVPTLARVFVDDILLQGKVDWLEALLLGMALTSLVRAALVWLKQRYLLRLYTKLAVTSSARFLWHVLQLPIAFFLARFAGEIGSRVELNDKVAALLSGRIADLALDLVMVLFYGALMLTYDVPLALIGVSVALLNLLALRAVARQRIDASTRLQQEHGKLVGVSMGGLQIIETLKSGGNESDFFAKWSGHWAKVQNTAQELAMSSLLLGTIPGILSSFNTLALLTLGGLRVIDGEMTVGMLVAFQALMASFLGPVNNLLGLGTALQEAQADVRRLDDVLDHPRATGTVAGRAPDLAWRADYEEPETRLLQAGGLRGQTQELEYDPRTRATAKLSGQVTLSGVTFGYQKYAAPLLDGLTLDVLPGMRVALVGGSGSGKSTVARLVAGLYEPWAGVIRFDGKLRTELPPAVVQASVAMVDQDISLFEGTVRDNLTLWDRSIPDSAVVQAAKDAAIHDDIAARPGGYDSKVEEAGRNFSGGQRQRLEIARALVRNPTLLLLDEATSALDPRTEEVIDQNLRRRGCSCLIVAHRLSTIRDADHILVLEQGVVVERGDHHQLMEAKGRYAKLMGAA